MSVPDWLERTVLLLGEHRVAALRDKHVLVAGLGGVGAYAAEMICRGGVGRMTIVDGDTVQRGNRNRQLAALTSTEGHAKAAVMAARLRDIDPTVHLEVIGEYIRDERLEEVVAGPYDYVVDAIDTLSPKVFLINTAVRHGIPVVSSLGAGGKIDPSQVRIDDISRSHHCRLGKMLRKRLHRLGIREGVTVVYSPEEVDPSAMRATEEEENKKTIVGTISYLPPIFGCFCASVVLRALMGDEPEA
ncbi:MAG: tRNA threonylcarbamoyladenosine dehydratase [Bacteroidota bacterium]|jgi:tRNA A37 threonylcarbamoyladenosine dehydratase|nr:tRNA threonylcarbamoyladenosine dehydratase [Bacteroidota bacterium]